MDKQNIIKAAALLERFILNSRATNEEHKQAIEWLSILNTAAQKSIEDQDQQS